MKKYITYTIAFIITTALITACASVGSPDGGPYDETPPVFLGSTPEPFALGVKSKRISLEFDEYIKIEKETESGDNPTLF